MIWLAWLLVVIAAAIAALGVLMLRHPVRDGFDAVSAVIVFGCAANALWPAIAIMVAL